ncbi:hypothetical protein [Azospirillum thiophilum]|uniref:hypothetical protein n=1 Tax=Azospirillum thiophilum TaxID=528244 RepID=UPI000AF63DF3|nr:hypothetical protein [Azospirillum thiophilum]
MSELEAVMGRLESSAALHSRIIPYNYNHDKRLSDVRKNRYRENFKQDLDDTIEEAIAAHHTGYLARNVGFSPVGSIMPTGLPETFEPIVNGDAVVGTPQPDQKLLRLEMLDWVLDKGVHNLTRAEFLRFKPEFDKEPDQRSNGFRAFVGTLIFHWNGKRDNRPMFAAFADEVADDADADDWVHRLRSRLGLGHITPYGTNSILVALMRYPVKAVLDATPRAERASCFAVPTALDGPLNPYFFPAPAELRYGRALSLHSDSDCRRLTAEVLHRRIDYAPDHLIDVAEVRRVDDILDLIGRRNQHLACLRRQPGCATFGEELV